MSTEDHPSTPDEFVFDNEKAERLSRFLALVLRHRAHHFDLDMDDEGYVYADDLLDVIDERQSALSWVEFEHIEALTKTEGRKRFEIKGDQVRATYGHSFKRPVHYEAAEPPEQLYVGLAKSRMAELRAGGLRPLGRQYVHLSEEYDEAMEVGRHQGEDAVVVTVNAGAAHEAGVLFYRPTVGIFLAARVAPEFLELQAEFGRSPRKSRRRR